MTVAELIAYLQALPQDMQIAYCCYSEQRIMDLDELVIVEACAPRPDGWVHDARPDKDSQPYLLFPGN